MLEEDHAVLKRSRFCKNLNASVEHERSFKLSFGVDRHFAYGHEGGGCAYTQVWTSNVWPAALRRMYWWVQRLYVRYTTNAITTP